jgi:ATP-binding cassette subfamily F protein 3
MLNEENTVYEEMEEIKNGFENRREIVEYLEDYCFEVDILKSKIDVLSGGEKNLLQLAKIGKSNANLLLLDEPTSHLDTYAQIALEKAIADYKGAVLMVSHDFYTIANCVDYVLFVEDKSIRKMRIRSFRKMIYEKHFNKDYLELEQKKKELEQRIEGYLRNHDFESAKAVCEQLEEVVQKMN